MTIEEILSKLLSLVDDKLRLEKELEVYKKALELACEDIKYERCQNCRFVDDCWECKYSYDYVDEYLQKASEEE